MQNIIKHKRISSLAILMILIIVFAMSIVKSAEAVNSSKLAGSALFGVGPDDYVQVMFFNNICSDNAQFTLSVFNADDGSEIGSTFVGDIEPDKGAIRTFFDLPHPRSNIVVKIVIECPKKALKFTDGDNAPVILEIVDSGDDSTLRRIPTIVFAEGREVGR